MNIASLSYGDLDAMKERSPGHKKIYYTCLNLSRYHRVVCLNFVAMKDAAGVVRVNENFTIEKIKLYYPTLFFHLDKFGLAPFVFVHAAHEMCSRFLEKRFSGFDMVIVDNFLLSGLLPASFRKPVVYASHNVEYDWWKPILKGFRLGRSGLNLIRRIEQKMCRECALVFTVSEGDRRRFAELYGCGMDKIHFFPMGCEDVKMELDSRGKRRLLNKYSLPENKKRVLFCGSDFYANREIVDILLNVVAPGLNDDIVVMIAGSIENYIRSRHPSPPGNIRVLGFVEDIREIYAISDLAVNPATSGGGANMKTIEYLGAGLPLVATRFGVRGYEALSGIVTISSPENMADEINRHFNQDGAGLDFSLLKSYEWGAIAKKMNSVLTTVQGGKP